ncbi:MAG: cohesin domain-containing protein, partial [Bacteroidota bacterium]
STQDANVITQALAGNASALAAFNVFWRFIPTTYVMPVTGPNVVASFPESITLNITGADVTGQDFFGVKLGDLNGSANPLAVPTTGPLVWTVRDEVLQAGKEYELQFAANGFSDLAAFQFGIDFDPSQLQLLSHSHTDAISMTSDNFGAGNAGIGEFRVVWSNVDGVTLTPGTNVFRLRFRALETGMKLSEVVKLDDSVLECLAFTETMAQGPVRLVFTTTTATDTPDSSTALKLQLMQNIPNPFVDVTTIGFILPDACEAVIRVTDVSGREITRYQRQYSAGYHEMEFRMENAAGYGVLFYELITPFGTQSKKMITGSR